MTEQIICRHGVVLCYRCGIGKNVTEQKIVSLAKMDQAFEHLPVNSLAPTLPKMTKENPNKKTKTKKRPITPCIHRGDYVGELGCSCDGTRETYRCTKLDRIGHPGENAFCMQVLTSKPYSRIINPKKKQTLHRVKNGEVIVCKELHNVAMNGTEHLVGCPLYEPDRGSLM